MCTLAVYHRQFAIAPIVIAANRDEFYDRATAAPCLLSKDPPIFGGRDQVRGGTWLGVNDRGVAAALLNRRSATSVDPIRRSRGLLCLDALRHDAAGDAIDAMRSLRPTDYNPFNLLIVDPRDAFVITNNGRLTKTIRLERGLHLISNLDVDDPECPRIATSTKRFAEIGDRHRADDPVRLTSQFRRVLENHGTPLDPREDVSPNGLCVHLSTFGTRSSSLLVYNDAWSYLHAAGPPCEYPFEPIDLPNTFAKAAMRH